MGMFDDIKCRYPLPLPADQGELEGRNWGENGFQTKSFECFMDEYEIRESGTLWQQLWTWGETSRGRPVRKPGEWQQLTDYTGEVEFHDFIYGVKSDYSMAWLVIFVSGKLTEIKLTNWEISDNTQRLTWKKEREVAEEKRSRFLATWFGRHIYPGYAWLVYCCFGRSAYRCFDWLGRRCNDVGGWMRRVGGILAPHGDPIRAKQRQRKWDDWFND